MQHIQTKYFGDLPFPADAIFEFPGGLPGFEIEHIFVFIEQPATHPLIFMQSSTRVDVCFVMLPVLAADPAYKLDLSEEELLVLGFPADHRPQIGKDILCAVMVCAAEDRRRHPTVNLFAPVIVNLQRQIGIQAIQTRYSPRHPLIARSQPEVAPCS